MKVLVVRFSALGDLILITGPIKALKDQTKDLKIDLLTSEVGAELFQNNPLFNDIIVVPKGSNIIDWFRIYIKLPKYDSVIDLQGHIKSYSLHLFLQCPIYHIQKQSSLRRKFVKTKKGREKLNQHVVEKYYQVIQKAFSLKSLDIQLLRPQLPTRLISYNTDHFDFSKAVAIHPYASQNNKVWPQFYDLINELIHHNYPVVIIGNSITPLSLPEHPKLKNLTNRTCLNETKSILASVRGLITTDSGPMHLAIALNKPTLAIFGPTTSELGFYPKFKHTAVVEVSGMDCRPCHVHGGDHCPLGHFRCMKDITVHQVLYTWNQLINCNDQV